MDWSAPVDLYCERTDAAFWAEPANALSNAAFVIAAAAAAWWWRRAGGRDVAALALIAVVFVIAIGSFGFHTVATRGALLGDVIPIAVFVHGYLFLALRRFLGLSLVVSATVLAGFAAAAQALPLVVPPRALNGSIDYVPALVALIAMARAVRRRGTRPARRRAGLDLAVMLFTVSLALRSVDLAVCDAFPLGTHFLWHVLNAAVLYVLVRTAIAGQRQPDAPPHAASPKIAE